LEYREMEMSNFKTDRELCEEYATELSNGFYRVELDGFSEACFNQNSENELREALKHGADETDCRNWNITPEQWRGALESALAARIIVDNDDKLPS
jgi:hypothetical protein